MEEELNIDIEERKKKVVNFLKHRTNWVIYTVLAIITFLGVFLRTRNISKLKDITTGSWTLGPDLDPFLFLRWAKSIVANGSLFVLDTMRSVPLSEFCSGATCNPINTAGEMKLLPYMMAYFHKFLSLLGLSNDVTFSSIWFPVVMFGLTTIAFFLFARKIFYKQSNKTKNSIALIATLFFVLIPSLLPRTIAGIPEKESAAFFFMFLAFYFFLEAFTSDKLKRGIIFGVLSSIATACMALIWGGFIFIFYTIAPAFLFAFILGKVKWKELGIFFIWLLSSIIAMSPFSTRYSLRALIPSLGATEMASAVVLLISLSLLLMKNGKLMKVQEKTKFPREIFFLILSILVLAVIVFVFLGPNHVWRQIIGVKNSLIEPQVSRFGLTVAENAQPYFANDWKNSFGPIIFNIPLFFWLFFTGSVVLFNSMIEKLSKKERIVLTFGYLVFLFCLIFSRYSSDSVLNGTSVLSHLVYFGGVLFFAGYFGYYYVKIYRKDNFSVFREFNLAYILYFVILTLGIIGARGGIRLIMVLGAVSPIAVGFLVVKTCQKYFSSKDDMMKFFVGILALIIVFSSGLTAWNYYQTDKGTSENFAPGIYQYQWQEAMRWVRENTSQDSVFAHWWDYGYWLQSIGERATILDGGNAIVYWNHLLGRHVLTGTDEMKSLEFLYTHNATHLLMDSTDIGKYTAFSSIGSDESYDRFSWIPTFVMNDGQTQESKNETIYIYSGGSAVDEDTIWNYDGNEVFLPKKSSAIGAITLKKNKDGSLSQPVGIFVYNSKQYAIPLRYMYYNGLRDFGAGLDAGIFLFPRLDVDGNNAVSINEIGASLYLSKRTVHSELARLYLFDGKSDYFKLAHSEDNYVIKNLESQGTTIGDFVYYQGFQGPIKIWELSYPSGMQANPEYLELDYPNEGLWKANPGEY